MRALAGLTLAIVLAAAWPAARAAQEPAGAPLSGPPVPTHPLSRFESVEPHMGTLVRITVYADDEARAREAFRAGFARIAALDRTLSDYRADSELSRITRRAVRRAVPVSRDLFEVLRAGHALASATGGAFDITAAPIIRLWREARRTGRLPARAALAEAARRSGYRRLHLDPARRTVRFDRPGMSLDAGALGKGYAASEAVAAIGRLGMRSALVAISGDLAFGAAPPGQRGWRVRVTRDDPPPPGVPAWLELADAAVSTAGSSEQYVEIGGRRYSHIIDPSTRAGLVEDITVTVVAPHGLDADGLDTAASLVGVARGLALVESRPGAAALIIRRAPGAGAEVHMSPRFRALARQP